MYTFFSESSYRSRWRWPTHLHLLPLYKNDSNVPDLTETNRFSSWSMFYLMTLIGVGFMTYAAAHHQGAIVCTVNILFLEKELSFKIKFKYLLLDMDMEPPPSFWRYIKRGEAPPPPMINMTLRSAARPQSDTTALRCLLPSVSLSALSPRPLVFHSVCYSFIYQH